jgi:hypothetical protein
MSAPKDLDRLLQSYLGEGPLELPDPSYDEVRSRMDQTRQRAVIGSWRTPDMNRYLKVGLTAAAAVVIAVVAVNLLPGSAVPGGDPTATPEASEAPASVEPSAEAFLPEGSFAWFEPTVGSEPRTDVPPITVTIPASGWACPQVGYEACSLIKGGGERSLSVPEPDGRLPEPDGRLPESAFIAHFTTRGIHVYQDPCQWEYNLPHPPATTADEIAAALSAQPSRDASDPVDVTVGGYPGKVVTLHVPDDAGYADGFTDCFRGVYASYTYGDHDADGSLPSRWHQGPGQIDTFWIVEVDDAIVIIDAMYRADTPADRIQEMRAIAESATFEAP